MQKKMLCQNIDSYLIKIKYTKYANNGKIYFVNIKYKINEK